MLSCAQIAKFSLILALACVITACGFVQRGAVSVPDYLTTIYITPNDPYDPFQSKLRFVLRDKHINVVNHRSDSVTILKLSKIEIGREVLASGSSGQAQRFRLNMSLNYTLTPNDKHYPAITRTITRGREVSITNDKLLANDNAEQIIRNELIAEVISELLRQISTRPSDKASVHDSSTSDNSPC